MNGEFILDQPMACALQLAYRWRKIKLKIKYLLGAMDAVMNDITSEACRG